MDEEVLNKIICGDSEKVLQNIPVNSVDLIVTDPPYGISFMGKDWDKTIPSIEIWKQCFHVLKPGAFMFVMSSPRLDVLVEMGKRLKEAGFEIGFSPIFWVYATGFSKALNISKVVDARLGFEREVIDSKSRPGMVKSWNTPKGWSGGITNNISITKQAKQFDGSYSGFSPKPACELVIVCMKSLSENSYVEQALSNQKGITWLDDGRIPFNKGEEIDSEACPRLRNSDAELRSSFGLNKKFVSENYEEDKLTFRSDGTGKNYFSQYIIDKRGRFPANLLVEDNVLDDGKVTKTRPHGGDYQSLDTREQGWGFKRLPFYGGDEGEFSRYFSLDNWWDEKVKSLPKSVQKTFPFLVVPKPSFNEKDKGLKGFEKKTPNFSPSGDIRGERANIHPTIRANIHPTIKPLKLFSYLITIGSRPNDLVLDPFVGSGTAAIVAKMLDRNYIGIDISEEYCKIAEARLKAYKKQKKLGDDL